MPNWCENELTVTGPADALDLFKLQGLDFNRVLPYPQHFQTLDDIAKAWEAAHPYGSEAYRQHFAERPKDGYNQGGYEWCSEHWGVKWNVGANVSPVNEEPGRLVYAFNTPWGPPLLVVEAWARQHPALTFKIKYWEGGMGFQGALTMRNTRTVAQRHGTYRGPRGG